MRNVNRHGTDQATSQRLQHLRRLVEEDIPTGEQRPTTMMGVVSSGRVAPPLHVDNRQTQLFEQTTPPSLSLLGMPVPLQKSRVPTRPANSTNLMDVAAVGRGSSSVVPQVRRPTDGVARPRELSVQLGVSHVLHSSTSEDSGNATSITHGIHSTPATSTEQPADVTQRPTYAQNGGADKHHGQVREKSWRRRIRRVFTRGREKHNDVRQQIESLPAPTSYALSPSNSIPLASISGTVPSQAVHELG